jgi:hypothetical protein
MTCLKQNIAVFQSCSCPLSARNAARTPGTHQSHFNNGVPCFRDYKVNAPLIVPIYILTPPSEGKNAQFHYMICGVQGDFTRGLVNDPPRTLWTRQLKVK